MFVRFIGHHDSEVDYFLGVIEVVLQIAADGFVGLLSQ